MKSSKSLSCDFEDGSFCNWRQETHDEFNWTLGQGPTSSEETGPETDHTKLDDTGHYAFIEASAPAEVQDMAVLRSPPVNLFYANQYCLSLWFHIYGSGVGVLAIVVKEEILWSMRTEVAQWTQVQINIPRKKSSINIQIIGVRGGNYKSDIAVDDIEFKKGACPCPDNERSSIRDQACEGKTAAPTDTPRTTRTPSKPCKPWQNKKCCKNSKETVKEGTCNCRCKDKLG